MDGLTEKALEVLQQDSRSHEFPGSRPLDLSSMTLDKLHNHRCVVSLPCP